MFYVSAPVLLRIRGQPWLLGLRAVGRCCCVWGASQPCGCIAATCERHAMLTGLYPYAPAGCLFACLPRSPAAGWHRVWLWLPLLRRRSLGLHRVSFPTGQQSAISVARGPANHQHHPGQHADARRPARICPGEWIARVGSRTRVLAEPETDESPSGLLA